MSTIKIDTLTYIHVGSGETLQYGNDFVIGKDSDGDAILGIIDAKKVMQIIGEENIDNWVNLIERKESTDKIVNKYASNKSIDSYSKRTILVSFSNLKGGDTLKELIHNGQGKPYIPGSSIKGAIRTAVLSSLTDESYENKIATNRNGKIKVTAKEVEKTILGKDANSDIFRFLQVGDAYFGTNYEAAIRMVNINERNKEGFWDTSKSQLIEVLCPDDETTFQMRIKLDEYRNAREKVNSLPACMESMEMLFKTINEHTKTLLEQEIEYWKERSNKDTTSRVDDYLEKIEDILSITKNCVKDKECVLRIGHGSGWRFITGAWTEDFSNFDSVVIPASRFNYSRYIEYDFPKTRRVDEDCDLLGFVKLSIL